MPTGEDQKARYEGLNDQAAALWRQWLKLYQEQFAGFTYNVRVGRGLDPGPNASEEIRKMWHAVTTKRIDVVAHRLDQTWVIEIEPRPGLRTLGQVVGYVHLLPQYHPTRQVIVPALIAGSMGFDMSQVFRAHNISYFVFPSSGPPRLPPLFPPTYAPSLASPVR